MPSPQNPIENRICLGSNLPSLGHREFNGDESLGIDSINNSPNKSMVVEMVPLKGGRDYITIYNPPEGKDYKWYISGIYCQLGDGLCHLPPFRGTRNSH